jgi:hypothetical protein
MLRAKSAVAWYRSRSPKAASDFVGELDRAVDTIREGDFLFQLFIPNKTA